MKYVAVIEPHPKQIDTDVQEIPQVFVTLTMTQRMYENATKPYVMPEGKWPNRGPQPVTAFVYRLTTRVPMQVTVGDDPAPRFDGTVTLAQLSDYHVSPAVYKPLTKGKTVIAFSVTTGSLKEFGIETDSSAAGFSGRVIRHGAGSN